MGIGVTSIKWVLSEVADAVLNVQYRLYNMGALVWTSDVIPRIPPWGEDEITRELSTPVPNVVADTLVVTAKDVERSGHEIYVNETLYVGEMEPHGDMVVFDQTFSLPTAFQHTITLEATPVNITYIQPAGVTPFTVLITDGQSITVEAPPEIEAV